MREILERFDLAHELADLRVGGSTRLDETLDNDGGGPVLRDVRATAGDWGSARRQ